MLGRLAWPDGRRDDAIDHLHDAVDADFYSASALYQLGGDLVESGRPNEAATYLRQTLEIAPERVAVKLLPDAVLEKG